jgi:hypothetical protein
MPDQRLAKMVLKNSNDEQKLKKKNRFATLEKIKEEPDVLSSGCVQ